MSDKPVSPLLSESARATKFRHLLTPHYIIPVGVILLIGFLGVLIYLQPHLWFSGHTNTQDLTNLENQTATLNTRVEQLEATIKAPEVNSIDVERLKDMETRISSVFQQLEAIQNQPKADMSPQQIERSQSLEKDVSRLADTQNILKSLVLFGRMKTVILSDAPYRAELNDFKSVARDSEELAFIEKYADQGLQVLKETQSNSQLLSLGDSADSWWDRVKALASSFITIEKVDETVTSAPTALQERQTVEEVIKQIEQTLVQQLMTSPLAPSPQSGDAL